MVFGMEKKVPDTAYKVPKTQALFFLSGFILYTLSLSRLQSREISVLLIQHVPRPTLPQGLCTSTSLLLEDLAPLRETIYPSDLSSTVTSFPTHLTQGVPA